MKPLIEYLRNEAPVLLRSFFWPMLWQSSLLIVLLFVIDLGFRRRLRPAIRYCLWLVVFLKLLLPPSLALPTSLAWWLRPATHAPAATRTAPLLVTYGPLVRPQPVPPSPAIALPAVSPPLPAAAWLLPMSAAISLALLAWMGLRWWQIARCVNQATPVSESLLELLAETSRCVGFSRPVGLRLTDTPISPAVCGFVRPVILLPRSLAERLPNSQLRAVLLHELAHLRRRDVWVNCAQALLQTAYWWHPLLWLANARVRRLREEAVDDAVMVALAHEADTYAPTLLEVAKLALARPLASLGLVGILEGRQALRRRIERLVDFRPPPKAGLTLASAICVAGLAALAVPMGEAPPKTIPADTTSGRGLSTWPAPRLNGYGKVALKARFFMLDRNGAQDLVPSLPLVFLRDQLGEMGSRLTQSQAQSCSDSEGLDFEQFSGGRFHYRVGGCTNNSVNYLTRENATQQIAVIGAEVELMATQPGWTPLDLTVIPWNQPDGISCQLEFSVGDETRQANLTIPFGGALIWVGSPGRTAPWIRELVVLQEMTLATNMPSPVTANAGALTPNEAEASQLLKDGQLLYEAGKLDESAAKLTQSLMANSNNPSAHFYLGLIEAARSDSKRASAPAAAGSAKALTNTLVQNGKLLFEMGKFDEAQTVLRDALRQDPHNQAAGYYLNLAQQASYTNVLQNLGGASTNPAPHALQDLDTMPELVQFLNTPRPQIHISSQFIEIPATFEREFWGAIGVTNLERQNISRILTPAQAQGILQKIKATPGVNVLAQPSVTTLDGRQCEVQVVDIMTIVTNFDPRALTPPGISSAATGGNSAFVLTASLPFGPTLDIVPHLSSDGLEIELATTGTVSEFLGYEKPKKKTPIYVDGKKHLESQPLPRFRIREITNRATVPDGYSLLLGKPVDESGLAAEEPEDGKKHLLVLITPSLIDAAGNRLHPEPAVPTRK